MVCCFGGNDDCVFCNIKESVGTRVVQETDDLIAFKDRSPSANIHLLIIPKEHIRTVKSLDASHSDLLSRMLDLGKILLKENGYDPEDASKIRLGFHVPPFNSVNHLHLHVIGLPFKNKIVGLEYKSGLPWFAEASKVLDRLKQGLSPV